MSPWELLRDRRERKRRAFQLLTLSGTIRRADVLQTDRRSAKSQDEEITTDCPVPQDSGSIWTTDLRSLWRNHRRHRVAATQLHPS